MPAPPTTALPTTGAAHPADRSSPRRLLSPAALAAAGLAAYALALVATLPARVVAPAASDAVGTAWHGSATLPSAAATARWDFAPGASLATASLAAEWTLDGPATLLTGVAHLRPGATTLTAVRGRAGWGLLAAGVPGIAADCALTLDVALDRVAATDTRGTVATLPGTCTPPGRPPRAVPRLLATFAGTGGRVTTWTDRATTLATVAVAGKRMTLHLTAAGAAVLPGPGRPGDIEFEM